MIPPQHKHHAKTKTAEHKIQHCNSVTPPRGKFYLQGGAPAREPPKTRQARFRGTPVAPPYPPPLSPAVPPNYVGAFHEDIARCRAPPRISDPWEGIGGYGGWRGTRRRGGKPPLKSALHKSSCRQPCRGEHCSSVSATIHVPHRHFGRETPSCNNAASPRGKISFTKGVPVG